MVVKANIFHPIKFEFIIIFSLPSHTPPSMIDFLIINIMKWNIDRNIEESPDRFWCLWGGDANTKYFIPRYISVDAWHRNSLQNSPTRRQNCYSSENCNNWLQRKVLTRSESKLSSVTIWVRCLGLVEVLGTRCPLYPHCWKILFPMRLAVMLLCIISDNILR